MAKTKEERIASVEKEIAELDNLRKRLLKEKKEEERKARTSRLCKRAGLFESMLPGIAMLTDAQFEIFLKKTVANDYGKKILAALAEQGDSAPAEEQAERQWRVGVATAQTEGSGAGQAAVS